MKKETFRLIIRFLVGTALSLLLCAGMIMTEKLGSNKPLIQQASGLKGAETVMTVDGEVHAKMTPEAALELLEDIRKKEGAAV